MRGYSSGQEVGRYRSSLFSKYNPLFWVGFVKVGFVAGVGFRGLGLSLYRLG